jgi:hypothetical protein
MQISRVRGSRVGATGREQAGQDRTDGQRSAEQHGQVSLDILEGTLEGNR